RHTRFSRDWSSDVCSSDLAGVTMVVIKESLLNKTDREIPNILNYAKHIEKESMYNTPSVFAVYTCYLTLNWLKNLGGIEAIEKRSEERRVGKESRTQR